MQFVAYIDEDTGSSHFVPSSVFGHEIFNFLDLVELLVSVYVNIALLAETASCVQKFTIYVIMTSRHRTNQNP